VTRRLLDIAMICTLLLVLLTGCQAEGGAPVISESDSQSATQTATAYLGELASLAATASSLDGPGIVIQIFTPTASSMAGLSPTTPPPPVNQNSPTSQPTEPVKTAWETEAQVPTVTTSPPAPLASFNLAQEICSAQWQTNLGSVPCPADSNSPNGFAIVLDNPRLETRDENEIAIYTHPPLVDNSWISGTYPPFVVQPGDRFLADIGCLKNFSSCQVEFQLAYSPAGKQPVMLGQWQEQNDQHTTRLDIDLSDLAGQTIQLILTVHTQGDSGQAGAFWLVPQIQR